MNKYSTFDSWFLESTGDGEFRYEQCYLEAETHKYVAPLKNLREWLERAFYAAREQKSYRLVVEGEGDDLLIQLPEEVMVAQGWKIGTTISWHDNGDDTWTLKAKK